MSDLVVMDIKIKLVNGENYVYKAIKNQVSDFGNFNTI